MLSQRWRFAGDWNTGNFNTTTTLDSAVNVSQYGHPALIPNVVFTTPTINTGKQVFNGTSTPVATLSGGNAYALIDTIMATAKAGDFFTFTTTAPAVQINLTGVLASGTVHSGGTGVVANAIRNGGLVQILVDGVLAASADCAGAAPSSTIYLDGASHTIKVLHTGNYSASTQPIGAVTPLVGTTVSAGLSVLASTTQKTFGSFNWRVLATSSTQFSLFHTPPGSAETLVASGLNVGTTYDSASDVPGVSLRLTGTLTTNDSATFTTDLVMSGVVTVVILNGSGGNTGTYTSEVIDSGAANTQWFLARWAQSSPMATFNVASGNTPVPDSTWRNVTVTPISATMPQSGIQYGYAGLSTIPRGRYAQWTIGFPVGLSSTKPWIRDLTFYYWVPAMDPFFLRLGLANNWVPGPNMNAIAGVICSVQADTRDAVLDFIASYAIGGAVDQYLQNIGADLGVPQYSGEPPLAYRSRLQAALATHPNGASPTYIASQVASLVGGIFPTSANITSVVNTSSQQTVTVMTPPMITGPVVVAQGTAGQYSISIPAPVTSGNSSYPGLPGVAIPLAQAVIAAFINNVLNPATGRPSIVFN